MHIKVEIDVDRSKYGSSIAHTELTIDSDVIDDTSLKHLVAGIVQSAIDRAHDQLEKDKVEPTAVPAFEQPSAA